MYLLVNLGDRLLLLLGQVLPTWMVLLRLLGLRGDLLLDQRGIILLTEANCSRI